MSDAPLPDNLETFLNSPPSTAADAPLRDALLERTQALLPRKRGWNRVLVGMAIAASLALAFLAGYLVPRPAAVEPERKNELVEQKELPKAPPEDLKKPPVIETPTNPRELEWVAFDADTDSERVRLYFQAGNLFLDKHNDVQSAMRCYQQAIFYSEERELEFHPDDNWLVLALKRDQRKER